MSDYQYANCASGALIFSQRPFRTMRHTTSCLRWGTHGWEVRAEVFVNGANSVLKMVALNLALLPTYPLQLKKQRL